MPINLNPETERLVREALENGDFHSVDEMIITAVRTRKETKSARVDRKTPPEVVAHIRELRRGNVLSPGISIKDLINEGRA
jgi:hypothetical protein